MFLKGKTNWTNQGGYLCKIDSDISPIHSGERGSLDGIEGNSKNILTLKHPHVNIVIY